MVEKKNDLVLWIVIGLLAYSIFTGQQPVTPTPPPDDGGIDLCQVVEPAVSFTAQRMFLSGTSITTEYVRVLKDNGANGLKDLSQTTTNSGTLSTAPEGNYRVYYGENGSTYYTVVERYVAPCQDATDDKVGVMCTIDTSPTLTIFDEYSNVQSSGSNAQAIGSSEQVDIEIQVKVSADECYGNPGAPNGKQNAICLDYNTTIFKPPKMAGDTITAPYIISNARRDQHSMICYPFKLLKDTDKTKFTVTLAAQTGKNPVTTHNITVSINDMGFDLNADTLAEIWDYQDETLTELGASAATTLDIDIS